MIQTRLRTVAHYARPEFWTYCLHHSIAAVALLISAKVVLPALIIGSALPIPFFDVVPPLMTAYFTSYLRFRFQEAFRRQNASISRLRERLASMRQQAKLRDSS